MFLALSDSITDEERQQEEDLTNELIDSELALHVVDIAEAEAKEAKILASMICSYIYLSL